jgi:hypothetical protein
MTNSAEILLPSDTPILDVIKIIEDWYDVKVWGVIMNPNRKDYDDE